ncbi:YicC/YloC family endoribonuclease [Bacillus marinisedimentorum]|uniref:YicC/YloC family endoribonuclease n=1 Tax=Bacillus marinisedimentorum TaxID=1821260 RepID=UPI0007E0AD7A|nr:YicC/YloC family endoribonuclease [Bacillus marinisedimentorum]
MIKSMTGYGRTKKESDQFAVTAEIKSVNHRFNEISVRMPRQMMMFEDKIKRVIGRVTARGKIDVFISLEGEGAVSRDLEVDWTLLDAYYEQIKSIAGRYQLNEEIRLSHLMNLKDAFQVVEREGNSAELEGVLLQAVEEAALKLVDMRLEEGRQLYKDISALLEKISTIVQDLSDYKDTVADKYRTRLIGKIEDFLNGTGEIDETRVIQEVAIFAEKADINEELTRLCSHIEQFSTALHSDDSVGRKLDFLVQEMNREMNTIGSKANDAGISRQVVEMKSALEKIKEQVQNIE